MRIRAAVSGDGWALYVKDRKVGYIREDAIGFRGFTGEGEAAEAACIAHQALARRRAEATHNAPEEYLLGHTDEGQFVVARSGVLARLLPPDPTTDEGGWGFEIALRPDESISVFATARARLMWSALRTRGLARSMYQFAGLPSMTGQN